MATTTRRTSAHDVAAAMIKRCGEVDALKLQKLVFLVAGEYLALTGKPIFDDPIEAWDYGPVVHTVYLAYKGTEGTEPIRSAKKGAPSNLNDVARACVDSVIQRFGDTTGAELIRLTHEMDPWANAYRPGQYRTNIDNQAIYDYFSKTPTTEQTAAAMSAWNRSRAAH